MRRKEKRRDYTTCIPTRSETGKQGEEIATRYLIERGFRILARNDRRPWGEIDIITRAPNRTLVFIEVKTMSPGTLTPEDQLSPGKLKRFRTAAALYAGSHPELVDERTGWRLDAIAITMPRGPEEPPTIRYYENVG